MRSTLVLPLPVNGADAGTVTFTVTSATRLFRRADRRTFRQLAKWMYTVAAKEMGSLWQTLDASDPTTPPSERYDSLPSATNAGSSLLVDINVKFNEGWRSPIVSSWMASVLQIIVHHDAPPNSDDIVMCSGVVAQPED